MKTTVCCNYWFVFKLSGIAAFQVTEKISEANIQTDHMYSISAHTENDYEQINPDSKRPSQQWYVNVNGTELMLQVDVASSSLLHPVETMLKF